MSNIDKSQLVWKILRLTETAISLVDSNKVDDALEMIENRDRAMNILLKKNNLSEEDFKSLKELESLNDLLLARLMMTRERLKEEIQVTHKNKEAHKAYHSGQVSKP